MASFMDAKYKEALEFHKLLNKPGKVSLKPTKPLTTQQDLSLAYSPGVAAPCLEISKTPEAVYDYTAKGNYVAVITNGTAILGLGNLGAAASKPVMEGKSVLFKRFADIDSVDIEVDTTDPDEFIAVVKNIAHTWGGINLEDIRSPECFYIEEKLKQELDIPVFHDDQHGTAITTAAGLINALDIVGKSFQDIQVVVNGPGAAGIACGNLICTMGVPRNNIIYCDQLGVVYKGRTERMNPHKESIAVETKARTLADAMKGADVFLGLSTKDVLTEDMLKSMAKSPIIFAMANPDPEVKPELAKKVRPDAIVATGRSDYNNQINNVMCFPYIFRGALDVRATKINEEMKIAAAYSIAQIARKEVPAEVLDAYSKTRMSYGPDYIIPAPFDPRLLTTVPVDVAKAAIDSGVAQKPISNPEQYAIDLHKRVDPTSNTLSMLYNHAKQKNKRVIFAEGEEEVVIRAAMHILKNKYATPILVGDVKKVHQTMLNIGLTDVDAIEIVNSATSPHNDLYIDFTYKKWQRRGMLRRDCIRAVKTKRNIFASCMLACGHGDAMITGITRGYRKSLNSVLGLLAKSQQDVFGMALLILEQKSIFIADTSIHPEPTGKQLANIAIQTANEARKLGTKPEVAFISSSNFGSTENLQCASAIKEAISILDSQKVDFNYEGEMSTTTALNYNKMRKFYPFSRLQNSANILIMPNIITASASYRIMEELGNARVIGPILVGADYPVQIVQTDSGVSDIVASALWAISHDVDISKPS